MTVTISADTPRSERKIAFVRVRVPMPFTDGHVCDVDEAAALNDAFGRRVSQQVAEAISEVSQKAEKQTDNGEIETVIEFADGWNLDRVQREIVDSYLNDFSWSVDRKLDPVEAEVRRLARAAVDKAMNDNGVKLDKDAYKAKVREVIEKNYTKLYKVAEKNVNTPLVEVSIAA